MADVEFNLGAAIMLAPMIPIATGAPTALPAGFPAAAGLYLIYNQNTNNRYMGISNNLNNRFAGRQGACFELGFPQNVLNNVGAFVGTMRYRNNGVMGWTAAPGYVAGNLTITLDGNNYDLEHMFIKAVQHAWPFSTISNTQKVGALNNASGAHAISIDINYTDNNGAAQTNNVTIAANGQLV